MNYCPANKLISFMIMHKCPTLQSQFFIAAPVASGGASVSTGGNAGHGKLRSQYQV